MFTRMWHIRSAAIGLVVLMASGCQSPKNGMPPKASQQKVSKVPVDAPEARELPPAKILPETHMAAGRFHESQGHLARAAEQYRLAIGVKPDSMEAYNRLGVVLDQLGKFNEADQCFVRAIQLSPKSGYLHNNLAFSYIMQGRWAEAQNELTKAIELQPEFPRARVNLGTVLAQQGHFQEAFESFRQVLPLEDAYYNVGLMYQSRRRPVEAAQAFKAALEANPKMVAAQKRLDLLPPSAVSEASKQGALFAFPVALTGQAPQNAPATRPAPAEGVEPEGMSAATPCDESDATFITELPAERDETQGWQFSSLIPGEPDATVAPAEDESTEQVEPSAVSGTLGLLAHPAEMIRLAIAPVGAVLEMFSPVGAMDMTEMASPLPTAVPAPEAEEPPVYNLEVTPSTLPAQ